MTTVNNRAKTVVALVGFIRQNYFPPDYNPFCAGNLDGSSVSLYTPDGGRYSITSVDGVQDAAIVLKGCYDHFCKVDESIDPICVHTPLVSKHDNHQSFTQQMGACFEEFRSIARKLGVNMYVSSGVAAATLSAVSKDNLLFLSFSLLEHYPRYLCCIDVTNNTWAVAGLPEY